MVYFLNTEIPNNKTLKIGLKKVFGINSQKASEVAKYFGISKRAKVESLTAEIKSRIITVVKEPIPMLEQ